MLFILRLSQTWIIFSRTEIFPKKDVKVWKKKQILMLILLSNDWWQLVFSLRCDRWHWFIFTQHLCLIKVTFDYALNMMCDIILDFGDPCRSQPCFSWTQLEQLKVHWHHRAEKQEYLDVSSYPIVVLCWLKQMALTCVSNHQSDKAGLPWSLLGPTLTPCPWSV